MAETSDSEPAVFRAIADPTRRRLLEALRGGPLSVNRLAESFPVSRPAISKHLRCLREAGLVSEERQGRRRLYRLQPQALGEVRGWVDAFGPGREPAPAPAAVSGRGGSRAGAAVAGQAGRLARLVSPGGTETLATPRMADRAKRSRCGQIRHCSRGLVRSAG